MIKAQPADTMLRPSLRGVTAVSTFRHWPLATLTEHGNLFCYKQESTQMDG